MSDADEAIHQLFEANRLMRESGERIAAAAGQTHARRMVLQAAADGATVADIARRLGLNRQGVQRVADELVTDGLGRYDDNPHHRVSKLFLVTDLGRAALTTIGAEHARWIDAVERDTAAVDWPRLRDDLAHLVQILRSRE